MKNITVPRDEDFEKYYEEVCSDLETTHQGLPDKDLVKKMYLNRYTVGEAITSVRKQMGDPGDEAID